MAPRRELSRNLERLHAELSASEDISPRERELLETLASDIEKVLDDEQASEHPDTLAGRLRELTADFEKSHPNLTFAIGAVADALSRLGI